MPGVLASTRSAVGIEIALFAYNGQPRLTSIENERGLNLRRDITNLRFRVGCKDDVSPFVCGQ
jgi:hypothetical protein